MRWSHTAVTASCAANGQTDRPKLKLVPFVTPILRSEAAGPASKSEETCGFS